MPAIELNDVTYALPGGRVLFQDVSFRVPDGSRVALIGANGTGKTTLLKLIAGIERPTSGRIHVDGRFGMMQQFISSPGDGVTVRDFLVSLAPQPVRDAAISLREAERVAATAATDRHHMRYATALEAWGSAGGYEIEVLWDTCTSAGLGRRLEAVADRPLSTLSGGEQKRLALEVLFRSDAQVLLLDEPDNFLDISGKQWLEDRINTTTKTLLFVSHDRTLLANTATRLVTLEGNSAWLHPEPFASYLEAREHRLDKIEEERRRYREEHRRLVALMKEYKRKASYNSDWASRARSMEKRVKRFEEDNAPRERPAEQDVTMRIAGGRTGKIALRVEGLEIPGIVKPFDAEIWFGDRVGVVGPNGTGKTHFLRLLAGRDVAHTGSWRLGARVEPSLFVQTHERPELGGSSLVEIIRGRGFDMGAAMSRLRSYELRPVAHNPYSLLSGGQQARFQLLMMELQSPTMLLLDEPTDNLDLDSAEALEEALAAYEGTVIAVTHDRWFMRLLDRFLLFNDDGSVEERLESPYL